MKGTIVILLATACLMGCKSIPIERVEVVHTHSSDTIKQSDTTRIEKETIIREANNGDSALLAKMGLKLSDNERLLLILQRELERNKSKEEQRHEADSVRIVERKVPVPVEGKVPFWDKVQLVGVGALICSVVVFIIGLIWWIRRRYKRC